MELQHNWKQNNTRMSVPLHFFFNHVFAKKERKIPIV